MSREKQIYIECAIPPHTQVRQIDKILTDLNKMRDCRAEASLSKAFKGLNVLTAKVLVPSSLQDAPPGEHAYAEGWLMARRLGAVYKILENWSPTVLFREVDVENRNILISKKLDYDPNA